MHLISDSLAVGNVEDAKRPPGHVGALLFLAEELDVPAPGGVAFAKVPLREFTEPDPAALHAAIQWLEQHGDERTILVCCRAGMGRSVSVVIAYLCCVRGMPYADALALAKARRPGATPLPRLEQCIHKVLELRRPPQRRSLSAQ